MEDELESHDYVILLHKTSGGMKFSYTSVDPLTNTLAPKLDIVIWPRLKDIVEFAACVFKNVLYVTGGRERRSGLHLRQVLRYEPDRGRWFECAGMKTRRSRHAAVVYNGRVFVMGKIMYTCTPTQIDLLVIYYSAQGVFVKCAYYIRRALAWYGLI